MTNTTRTNVKIEPASLDTIVSTAENLTTILKKETEILKAADMDGFKEIQAQKKDVSDKYEAQMRYILANKDKLEKAEQAMKEKLNAARDEMIEASKENQRALESTGNSLHRLGERILNSVRDSAQKNNTQYGSGGSLYTNKKTPISIGIGETA